MLRIAFPILLLAAAASAAGPDPDALLKQFDSLRNGWDSFVVRVSIRNFE